MVAAAAAMAAASPAEPQIKPLDITQQDKLFNRLLTKEVIKSNTINNNGNTSCRVYYAVNTGEVPFQWESIPGTPKRPTSNDHIPPLTPPPSFLSSNSSRLHFSSSKTSSSSSPRSSSSSSSLRNFSKLIFLKSKGKLSAHGTPAAASVVQKGSVQHRSRLSSTTSSSSSSCGSGDIDDDVDHEHDQYESPTSPFRFKRFHRQRSVIGSHHHGCMPIIRNVWLMMMRSPNHHHPQA